MSQQEFKVYDSEEKPANSDNYIKESQRMKCSGASGINRFYDQLDPYYSKEDKDDDTLIFESRFEHGNLNKAFRVGLTEYNLYLSPDTGTNKHE